MKQNISKTILILSVIGMMLVGIYLANIYKSETVVNDVYGSREALGDMNILFQKRGGLFETDEILISKEEETLNKFVKQGSNLMNLTKNDIKNRKFLKYKYNISIIFEDENSIGIFNSYIDSYDDNNNKMIGIIEVEDKESGKIESFEIDMGESLDINKRYNEGMLPVKKEGDILYVATMYSYYNYSEVEKSANKSENLPSDCNSTYLNLYKINLAKRTSEQVLSQEYVGNDISVNNNYGFSYNDKAYFVVDNKKENSDIYTTNLFEFDIKSKEINLIDLKTNSENLKVSYTVENNETLLISQSIETDSKGKTEQKTRAILVDLNNKNLKYSHHLDINYSASGLNADVFRRYDDKIYVVSAYSQRTDYEKNRDLLYTFYVFDEKSGEKFYEGNIEINSNYSVNMGIVKKDEI